MDRDPPTEASAAHPESRRRPRWLPWTAAAVGMLVVFGAVFVVVAVWRAEKTIESHRARLAAERTALDALPRVYAPLIDPPTPDDASAAFDAFFAALMALPRDAHDSMTVGEPGSHAILDEVFARHPQPLAAIDPLASASMATRPQLRSIEDVRLRRSLVLVNRATRWLAAATDRAIVRRDAPRALRLSLLFQAFGREQASSGFVFDEIAGNEAERQGGLRLSGALEMAPVSQRSAREARTALERLEASRPSASSLVAADRMLGRDVLLHVDPAEEGEEIGWRWLWSPTIWRAGGLNETDRVLDGIEAALSREDADVRGLLAELKGLPPPQHPVLRNASTWGRWLESRTAVRAQNAVVRARLAVLEWVAAKGAPPASLDELVPEILAEVPRDPWDGKPVRYADGRAWSVGKDGVDDGGKGDDVVAPPQASPASGSGLRK